MALPDVAVNDRLYVTDGQLYVDAMFMYTGNMGRTVSNFFSGGHNRTSIVKTVCTLTEDVISLVRRALLHIRSPYIWGNMRTYAIRTAHTKDCTNDLVVIERCLPNLHLVLTTVQQMYAGDRTQTELLQVAQAQLSKLEPILYTFMNQPGHRAVLLRT